MLGTLPRRRTARLLQAPQAAGSGKNASGARATVSSQQAQAAGRPQLAAKGAGRAGPSQVAPSTHRPRPSTHPPSHATARTAGGGCNMSGRPTGRRPRAQQPRVTTRRRRGGAAGPAGGGTRAAGRTPDAAGGAWGLQRRHGMGGRSGRVAHPKLSRNVTRPKRQYVARFRTPNATRPAAARPAPSRRAGQGRRAGCTSPPAVPSSCSSAWQALRTELISVGVACCLVRWLQHSGHGVWVRRVCGLRRRQIQHARMWRRGTAGLRCSTRTASGLLPVDYTSSRRQRHTQAPS